MHSREEIELQLWEYIDNVCDDAARMRIAKLIATENEWQQAYAELTAFHTSLQHMEPEHTSMRFTKNVMESIAGAEVARATRTYINRKVVLGIASIFILMLGFIVAYALRNTTWGPSDPGTQYSFDYSRIFNNNFVVYVLLANLLLLVIFFDAIFFRRKRMDNSQ